MTPARKSLIAAAIALAAGSGHALTVDMFQFGTNNWWGNAVVVPVQSSPNRPFTKTFDFWWSGTPAVGSVSVGGYAWSADETSVTFDNLALWRCGLTCNDVMPFAGLSTTSTRDTAGTNRYAMDPLNLAAGHYLFSFDIQNDSPDTVKLYAWAGVEATTGPAVSPVPEPATWHLMLAGLGAMVGASLLHRRRVTAQSPGVATAA